jgi:hypothetical protein
MTDGLKDDGVHIELEVSIYGANEEASAKVTEIALDAAKIMMVEHRVCGADVVAGLLTAAMALLDQHDNEHPLH